MCKELENRFCRCLYFLFFDGSHICRFLPILRPPHRPSESLYIPQNKAVALIISYLYLQIVTSASGNSIGYGKYHCD